MQFEKTITVNYKAGHSYKETWKLEADMFCPHCGKHGVWIEQGPGDYYAGEPHLCVECGWEFYMPSYGEGSDEMAKQRLAALS